MAAWHQLQQQQHTAERKKTKTKRKVYKVKEWMDGALAKCMKGGNYYLEQIFVQTKKSEWKIIIIK